MLDDEEFEDFLEKQRNPRYSDLVVEVNQLFQIKTNSAELSIGCDFFSFLLGNRYQDNQEEKINMDINFNYVIFEIFLSYLQLDYVVIPLGMGCKEWIELATLADMYCVARLSKICEQQLCNLVDDFSCTELMDFSLEVKAPVLSEWCADFELRRMTRIGS